MKGFWVMVATMAAVKAPPSSWPSMAMLTTPTRSQSTPEREPKTSGTASVTEPAMSPASEMLGVPGAAHHPDQEGDHEQDGESDRQPARAAGRPWVLR